MKDVLLIDARDRTVSHSADRRIYVADSGPKALQMLRTAVMDEVMVNLDGAEEDWTWLFKKIALTYPRLKLIFLSNGRCLGKETHVRADENDRLHVKNKKQNEWSQHGCN